tara:strand:+ start:1012 stop:1275 length:264 start_codon:yes stop_codon:yes gene_type:complete
MPSQSILFIGASGWVGPYFSAEFLAQKDKFARIAILSDASKISKFEKEAASGIEIVVGSYLEPESFKGPLLLPLPFPKWSHFMKTVN